MGTATGSVTLHPSGYEDSSNVTLSNITRAYNSTSNSQYATISISQSSTGSIFFTFDTSAIPTGATVTGVTGSVKVRVSNTTRVTSTVCQLYSGTTAKGSNVTFSSTSQSNVVTLSPGNSWTLAEVQSLRLKIGGTGSSSTSSRAIYLYGANITVSYSYTTYDITISNSTSATVTASESSVSAGGGVRIHTDTISGLTFKDNGVDVTSQFGSPSPESISATADDFTTGFSGGTSMAFYTSQSATGNNFNYAVGHTAESPGSTSSGSGSWTYVKENGSDTSNTGYADFEFDFSAIPAGSTINSVTIKCYGAIESTSQSHGHADITLYSGSTQKSTTQKFTSTSNAIITISSPGTWTRTELQSAKLRFTVGYYGGHIFGITWTVSYTESGYEYIISNVAANHTITVTSGGGTTTAIYYKSSGSWVSATNVYKKVNGSWVQQSDLANVFDSNTNYGRGEIHGGKDRIGED